ncbi:hypothetical protein VB694_21875, partial [Anabaena sp. UHCC 0451]|nr:hypothetical protein [Anabaena sp. UHCC 0451]
MLQNTDSQVSLINDISRLSKPMILPEFIKVNVNGILYFSKYDETNGSELWKTDTEGNEVLVSDINPGQADSNPYNLININDTLYFTADD